ncbi:hypothetical protein TcWFU_000360 [Taenia crassiceps]|uniref:Uncharacterized protein n=1 Tax=Taenia crassiceps TaxID=6207 RepID=A0ABR4QFE3_9CEST
MTRSFGYDQRGGGDSKLKPDKERKVSLLAQAPSLIYLTSARPSKVLLVLISHFVFAIQSTSSDRTHQLLLSNNPSIQSPWPPPPLLLPPFIHCYY